jgi:ABC-type glycerol-3-phosphate transport system substrate-binding protein
LYFNKKIYLIPCLILLVNFLISPFLVIKAQAEIANPTYRESISEGIKAGISDTKGKQLEIKGMDYENISDDGEISIGTVSDKNDVLIWDNSSGFIEYKFDVKEAGFYNILFEYYNRSDDSEKIERGLLINGKVPFAEANSFFLEQHFKFDRYPFSKDADSNEIRPRLVEVKKWYTEVIYDKTGMTAAPLKFYFSKGENTIKLSAIKGVVAISKIILKSPEETQTYNEYEAGIPSAKGPEKVIKTVEGENVYELSSKTIQLNSISEAGVSPETYGKRLYNTVGGEKWKNPGDWVEWKVEIPEDGIYNLAVKYQQGTNTSLSSYRTIEIDEKVPFEEMRKVSFPFSQAWSNKVFGDENPYKFYFTKGTHKIRLSVTSEPYNEVYQALMDISSDILKIDIKVKEVTGVTTDDRVDLYKIYDLDTYLPDLSKDLKALSLRVNEQIVELSKLSGSSASEFDVIKSEADILRKYSNNLDDLPKKVDSLTSVQSHLIDFATKLAIQPLLIDNILIKSVDLEFESPKAGIIKSVAFFIKQFITSFTNKSDVLEPGSNDTVEVWVQRNRDYVNLMQQYADEYFTPQSGIKVNVNYIPGQDILILANASGKQPDVITGISRDAPFNFALRNAIVPLSDFQGYEKLKKSVVPGAMVPYHYRGKDYGLPEEVLFNIMYYREDILQRYKIKVPQTWDEVKTIIPTLQQNNMNFWEVWGDWLTFFYQKGIGAYTPNGLDLAYDTPEGFAAVKDWSELYTKYNFPQRIVSFYQNFRTGYIPIGISAINDYLMLKLAAPEISNLWKISAIPGTMDEDGRNIRWECGDEKGLMMFKTNKEREERAWKYVQWWMSTETQTDYANDLENTYGIEFRWFSANPEVVNHIPWSPEDKKAILEQLNWFKGIPYAPGGSYILEREMQNAVSAIVIDKKNYRETLENTMDSIKREMVRLQQEFGLIDENGKIKEELDMLQVPLPKMEGIE